MRKQTLVFLLLVVSFFCRPILSSAQESPAEGIAQKAASPSPQAVAALTFTDVTSSANIVTESSGTHGASIADLDGDGFPEIYICSQEDNKIPSTNYMGNFLFKNNGNGTFSRIDASAGVQDIPSWAHASIFFDMDRDGDFDMANGHGLDGLVRRGLFRNNGNLTFTQVDATAGFQSTGDIGTRAIIAGDLNGDRLMDIHFSSFNGFDTEGYLGDGSGQFTRHFGLNDNPRSIQGLTAGDLDGDGDVDVMMGNFTSNDGVGYYRNNGSGVFTRVLTSGLPTTGSSFTAINLADVDADGDLDVLLVGEGLGAASLYLNNGSGTSFTQVQQMPLQTGCTGGCGDNGAFGDFDNDGDPDLFLPGAVQKIWLNNGNGSFTGVNDASSGVSYAFKDSRFPALFDYDRDGDLDLFLTQHDAPALLFKNNLNDNRSVRLRPIGPLGDKGGFGTKVWVYEPGHLDDPAFLISYQEAMASGGYCIQHEPILHFGVGSNASIDLRVKFINGSGLVLTGVTPGQTIDVSKPSNVVLSPNGGESFLVGQSTSILWAFDASITNVKLEFSTDNGLNWQVIASSTSNDGGFTGTVPNQASTQCLVRVSDAADGNPSDVSDGVFSIVVPAPPVITSFNPTSGSVGMQVTINGTSFTGATAVAFNATPATVFTVDSDTQIRATVPAGATTGKISVTTSAGTAQSATDFTVIVSSGGFALKYDGVNDYVEMPDNALLSGGSGKSITVEAWVKPDQVASTHPIIMKFLNGQTKDWGMQIIGGMLEVAIESNGDNWTLQAGNIPAGTWTHVAFAFDNPADLVRIFINGTEIGQQILTKDMPDTKAVLRIARHGYASQYLPGEVEDVRIWNIPRTASAIAADMNRELVGTEPGLIGYWTFNEGSGQTAGDRTTNGNAWRLGTSTGSDSSDPIWVTSTAPIGGGPPPAPSLQLTSPNGGESWTVGSNQTITWSSQGSIANVMLEYSADNGANWTTIISSTTNDGSHSWTVPNTVTTQALVRVSDAADGNPADVSDAVFSIVSAPPVNP